MSGTHPERSLNDARSARASLKQLGDTWWVNWALLSTAVALGCGGQPTASRKVFDELLEADQKPLERARTHLRYGEMLLGTADYSGARKQFDEAAAAFEGTQADYWAMRSLIGSISSRSPRAAALRRRALPLTKPDPIYRAAWRGNSTIAVSVIGTEQVTVNGVSARFETQRAEAAFFQLGSPV